MFDTDNSTGTQAEYIARRSQTVGEMFLKRVERDGDKPAFFFKESGQWQPVSWTGFAERAGAIASYLVGLGLQVGDKICMVGGTRPAWCYCDIGGQLAGAITLGAYPTLTPKQLAYILDHADTKVAFVEGIEEINKILARRQELTKLEKVVVWDTTGAESLMASHDWLVPFERVLKTPVDRAVIEARAAEVDPNGTAIIVYTSGTTGPPKGAMISHANIMTIMRDQDEALKVYEEDVSMSFLPMAHVAERILAFYGRINTGMSTYFASSIAKVLEEVAEVRPTVFGSVPRIFEKAYAKIMSTVDQAPPTRQKIFRWAERVGREAVQLWQAGKPIPFGLKLKLGVADKLVFSKLRAVFGGRVRYFVTGAAPIAPEILEFFWAAGFPIFEVYGMTESTVITHANALGAVKLGSVGRPLGVVADRIAEDGEILVKSDLVFQGYYKNPEATAETIVDGWLHTGDIGRKDDDGFLYIMDRKKHIIITAGGKNLTPANIENELKASDPLISQAHAHGDKRKYLVALVTIGAGEAVEWARQQGQIDDATANKHIKALTENPLARSSELEALLRDVSQDPDVRQRVVAAVKRANEGLARVETIKKIHILDREFSVEEDELTPTLKMKRKNIETKFKAIFDRLYDDAQFGLIVLSE
ncbi:MAG: long-chain fatty acid--CoA ligase [Deltaproteobacteria bacterium]|jgi:long-chain acyl-CoA synthetase|nr:long-chain fatty acid--CoA ligase [Deltaproteobacteria bacterium]